MKTKYVFILIGLVMAFVFISKNIKPKAESAAKANLSSVFRKPILKPVFIDANGIDCSPSNELQTISSSGTTSPTITLSSAGGSFIITGNGIAIK